MLAWTDWKKYYRSHDCWLAVTFTYFCLSLRIWDLSGTSSYMSLSAYLQLRWGILKSKVRMRMDMMSPLGLDGMRSQHMLFDCNSQVDSRISLLHPEKTFRNIYAALFFFHSTSHKDSLFCFFNLSLTFTLYLLFISDLFLWVCVCCFNRAAGWNPRWKLEVASV